MSHLTARDVIELEQGLNLLIALINITGYNSGLLLPLLQLLKAFLPCFAEASVESIEAITVREYGQGNLSDQTFAAIKQIVQASK